jgi:protoporphyrin/coproporphyrin ferrochelatase
MNYTAVLLTSFGGPEGPDEVMPFLERVTAGRGVPRERLEEVSHHYLALGGVSPINEQNRQLLAELKKELAIKLPEISIYLGNRNSEPYYADVLKQMYEDGHQKVLSLVTSAYSSYSGCRQYRENLAQALLDSGLTELMHIDKIRHYFDHPGFVQPFSEGLAAAVKNMQDAGLENSEIKIFFTTHSIPNSMAETSGPPALRGKFSEGVYVEQHLRAAALTIENASSQLGNDLPDWQLVYQSRSGSPQIPWLEPDIADAISESASTGTKGVILVPIGFVSDHVEVIWDLDNEAKEVADELNLKFARVVTPGIDTKFVKGLVDLISERVVGSQKEALSDLGPWPDFCAVGCCPNARADLPTVAQAQD